MANGNDIVRIARAQIGKPYVFGAVGPHAFDCSGLVVYCFRQVTGKSYPHFTGALINYGTAVSRANLAIGDLVFPDPGHVQIYSGNGKVIEAPHSGARVREMNMWGFWKARRLITPGNGLSTVPNTSNGQPASFSGTVLPASFTTISDTLAQPGFWQRLGLALFGVMLLLLGLVMLVTGRLPSVRSVAKAVTK